MAPFARWKLIWTLNSVKLGVKNKNLSQKSQDHLLLLLSCWLERKRYILVVPVKDGKEDAGASLMNEVNLGRQTGCRQFV